MNFAQEQLAKHGWKTGAGLGKDESGIKEPIKAKIKNDTRGVGHDAGKEFTFHWWDHMFNKTANSIQVETTENGVQVKKNDAEGRSKNKKSKTYSNRSLLYDQFVKGATLSDGNYKAESKTADNEESDHEEPSKSSIIPANEEELFKQCGGRTAHKGARHGLKLNGKLARIEQQEQQLLKQNSTSQNTDKKSLPNSDNLGQRSEHRFDSAKESTDLNGALNADTLKSKKRKHKESNTETTNAKSLEETVEPHTKTCKKKRKKDKRERKSDSDSHQNSDSVETVNPGLNEMQVNDDILSERTDTTENSFKTSSKKSKKKKKKKDRKLD